MTTKSPSPFVLEDAPGTMKKISNNLLSYGEEKITSFTLPFEGIPLTEQQLDAFMGKYTFRSWYEHRPDGAWHPSAWWTKRKNGDFPIEDEFDCEDVTLKVSGDVELAFESEETEDEKGNKGETRPAARITSIVLTPQAGGTTLLSFHMQVRPGLGQTNLALQEHQHRPVRVTLGATTLAKKKSSGQQSLALEPPKNATPVVLDGSHIAAAMGSAEGLAKLSTVLDAVTHDPYLDGIMNRRDAEHPDPDVNSPSTEVVTSHTEGDEVIHTYSDSRKSYHTIGTPCIICDVVPANTDDPAADLAKFEADAAERLKEFTNVSTTGAIDGRSERVKHQDRSKRRGAH